MLRGTPVTDFICAYFGKDWTITSRGFSSARQAEKHGLFMMPMAGCFGFAVIKETDTHWTVLNESIMSMHEKVTKDELNNYKVATV